jgi:hypothetical protein
MRILAPWAAMSHGFVPAQSGWLLDYIGSNYFVNLWTATKNKHYVILLTSAGLWCTAIAGIVTTSLFNVQPTLHTFTTNLVHTRMLNSSFTPEMMLDKTYINRYLGQQLGLNRPNWTIENNIVLEPFHDPSATFTTETLEATTWGYSADLNCTPVVISEGGTVTTLDGQSDTPYNVVTRVNVTTAGCQVTHELFQFFSSTPNNLWANGM